MRLGLDSFSFQIALASGSYDLFRTLDWMAARGLSGLQININGPDGRFLGRDPSDVAHLKRVRSALEQKGFFAEIGGGYAIEPTTVERQLRLAAALGADTLRTVVGFDQSITHTIEQAKCTLENSLPLAQQLGVRIAVENHEDITAPELHQVLTQINDPMIGACLDTGNDLVVYGDPHAGARLLAPLAVSTHIKDQKIVRVGDTIYSVGVPLGTGDIDLRAILQVIVNDSTLDRILIQDTTGYSAALNKFNRADLLPTRDYVDVPNHATETELRAAGLLLSIDGLSPGELATLAQRQEQNIVQDLALVRSLLSS